MKALRAAVSSHLFAKNCQNSENTEDTRHRCFANARTLMGNYVANIAPMQESFLVFWKIPEKPAFMRNFCRLSEFFSVKKCFKTMQVLSNFAQIVLFCIVYHSFCNCANKIYLLSIWIRGGKFGQRQRSQKTTLAEKKALPSRSCARYDSKRLHSGKIGCP